MTTATKIPGFVSQRKFAKYMKEYHANEVADDSVIDPVSRVLSSSGNEKGRKGEYMVAGMFRDMGYESKVLSGHDECDVLVKINGKWLNVEVKTASEGKTGSYQFHRIKTNQFDILVLVLAGKNCTTVQIGGAEAKKFITKYATWVVRDSAYSMVFNRLRRHHKMKGKDGIWFGFTKANVRKVI